MYADHASSALPTLFPAVGSVANPSAAHAPGRRARAAAGAALERIAGALRFTPPDPASLAQHLVATSGGTEADNLVLLQPERWSFIVLLPTEHHAVTLPAQWMANHHGCEIVYLTPDATGRLDPTELRGVLRARAGREGLVSVALVNNEIGTVQDLAVVGRTIAEANQAGGASERRVWLHTDAVQAPGHVALDLDGAHRAVDFLAVSAHKFHGPPGFGLLFCRTPGILRPRTYGGAQQGGLRPGTETVGALVAIADALVDATDPVRFAARTEGYRAMADLVWAELMPFVVAGKVLPTGATAPGLRSHNHVSFCVRGAHRRDLIQAMEAEGGIAVSGGSACNAEASLPSHVLAAIGVPAEFIHGSVRISFSHTNTVEEVRSILCPALRRALTSYLR